MKTCNNNCLHYDVCELKKNHYYLGNPMENLDNVDIVCDNFRDKSLIIDLTRSIGLSVWFVDEGHSSKITKGKIVGCNYLRSCGFVLDIEWDEPIMPPFDYKRKQIPLAEIGNTVFLTEQAAQCARHRR